MTDWNTAEDHVDRALEFFKRGRLEEAERSLRLALEIAPDRGDWLFNLALTIDAAGRLGEALEHYLAAASALPEEIEIQTATGIALAQAGRHEESLELLERACGLDPLVEEPWARRIEILAELERHAEAEDVYYLAQQYLEEFPRCLMAMGESLFMREELDRAAWCFREAATQDPTLPRIRARLAAVLARAGRTHRAVRMYIQDLREDPGSVETLMEFGDLLAGLGRHGEAEEKYRRILELQPASVEAHLRLARLSMRLGRHDRAITELELVRSLSPEDDSTVLHLASALLALKRTREARRLLVEHVTIPVETTDREELTTLCDLLLAAGLPGIATDVLAPIAATAEVHPSLLRRLAFARFDSGDIRGGDRVSRRLLRRDPGLAVAHENLVLSALQQQRPTLARLRLRRGLLHCQGDERLRRLRVLLVLRWIPGFLRRLRGGFTAADGT